MDFFEIAKTKPHNIHFLSRYFKFIESIRQQSLEGLYVERHHILPKSLFPEYILHPENIKTLSGRQHFIAHLLLAKAYPSSYAMALALSSFQMKNKHRKEKYFKITSKMYETLRKNFIDTNTNKGKVFYNNGNIQKMFFPDFQPEGWIRGRINKPWNKGLDISDERVKKYSELSSKSNKGKKTWNKGLTKQSDSRMLKVSLGVSKTLLGSKQSKETRIKRSKALKSFYSVNPHRKVGKPKPIFS